MSAIAHDDSRRTLRAAAAFGIDLDEPAPTPRGAAICEVSALASAIRPRTITHLTGPSGSGKSTLLRGLSEELRSRGVVIIDAQAITPPDAVCVDCFPCSLDETLRRLSSAGLAEARCFLRTPDQLSDGERFRLRLAIALHKAQMRAPSPVVLIIDEFAATIDRPTARSVSRLLRRSISASGNTAVITVTSHDDLAMALRPDLHHHLGTATPRPGDDDESVTEEGTLDDYRAMAHWHYRPGIPAAPVRTLVLRHTTLNEIVGALVVVMPTLNAFWRELAWPGRYTTGDKQKDTKRVNTEIRRLARIVIDPRFRGQGLARRLVREYLDHPLTPCTEAAAAMGSFNRFNEHAGMTAYPAPPSERHARLLDALDHIGVAPLDLASPAATWGSIEMSPQSTAFIERELRTWAIASRATSRRAEDDPAQLWRRACRAIASTPIGYAHTSTN